MNPPDKFQYFLTVFLSSYTGSLPLELTNHLQSLGDSPTEARFPYCNDSEVL